MVIAVMDADVIDINGQRLRLERIRAGEGWRPDSPVLVFLHERWGCIELWRDFPRRLVEATGMDALVYDRRGHGGSSPVRAPREPNYLHEEALTYLPAVLEFEGIDRAVLVGHSDGGSIALIHAAHHPRVLACITEAAQIFVEEHTLDGVRAAARAYPGTGLARDLERYHGDKAESVFQGWIDTWLSPAFREWTIEPELPGIRAPVLVMQGERDAYGTAEQVHRVVRGVNGPAEASLIPDCGDSPHSERPREVLTAISDFVRRMHLHTVW